MVLGVLYTDRTGFKLDKRDLMSDWNDLFHGKLYLRTQVPLLKDFEWSFAAVYRASSGR